MIGVAYIDDGPPLPCEMQWLLTPDGEWSYDLDWMDGGHVGALATDPIAGRIIACLMDGPIRQPAPRPVGD